MDGAKWRVLNLAPPTILNARGSVSFKGIWAYNCQLDAGYYYDGNSIGNPSYVETFDYRSSRTRISIRDRFYYLIDCIQKNAIQPIKIKHDPSGSN